MRTQQEPEDSGSTTGRLVAVVGLDGAGKSSQVRMLGDWLHAQGVPAQAHESLTMAPVRKALNLMAEQDGFEDHLELIGGETMRLVSACSQLARVSAFEKALMKSPDLMIVDRYVYCQYALAKAEGVGSVDFLRRLLGGARKPDLTIFLDVSPAEAVRRINVRGIDEESPEFLASFREAYVGLPEFADFVSVPGDGDFETVQAAMRQAVVSAFPEIFSKVSAT
ncbi:dTMP kinase [Streptomyces anulatus]|uniref:dTMP kinase n=1 Tax=Streptomyces anulatus TaxID=1892 RepID=UPI00340EAE8B